MIGSPKLLKYSLLVLAVGLSLKVWRDHRSASLLKSVDEYWSDTGIKASELEDLISNQTCGSSERYFLACANAVISVANRYNLQVELDGTLTPIGSANSIWTERQALAAWKDLFRNDHAKASQVSFLKVWQELLLEHIPADKKSFMIASGMNSFISIFRDPHTYLLPIAYYREVISKTDNKTASLGIVLGRAEQNYFIRKVYIGAPSEKAGIRKGDILLAVEGHEVSSLMPARVGELLRGEVGRTVKLVVLREGKRQEFAIVREQSLMPTVSFRLIEGIKPVGVLTINKFSRQTCERTKEALVALKQAGIRGLLLDLRDNPGGQMEEAACVASLFVGPAERIFEIKYLDPEREPEITYGSEDKIYAGRLAVLINGGSASAAEIVAGALRDLKRAVLVGERSFGKGSFQEGEVWTQNDQIALFETKGFYYLPSGLSPQKRGLEPDVRVDFKDALQLREVDQFMNPLSAPERFAFTEAAPGIKSLAAAKALLGATAAVGLASERASTKNVERLLGSCLEMEDGATNDDHQLGRARQVVFCVNGLAGVNQ